MRRTPRRPWLSRCQNRDCNHSSKHVRGQITTQQLRNTSLFRSYRVIETLLGFSANKKSGYERESAGIGFEKLAITLGPPAAPLLLPHLASLMDLYMDKGDVVASAATSAAKKIVKLVPPDGTQVLLGILGNILEGGKWKTKVGALDLIRTWVNGAKVQVAQCLGVILPKVEGAMHDTKAEVCFFFDSSAFLFLHSYTGRLRCPKVRRRSLHDCSQPRYRTSHSNPRFLHGRPSRSCGGNESSVLHNIHRRSYGTCAGGSSPSFDQSSE